MVLGQMELLSKRVFLQMYSKLWRYMSSCIDGMIDQADRASLDGVHKAPEIENDIASNEHSVLPASPSL